MLEYCLLSVLDSNTSTEKRVQKMKPNAFPLALLCSQASDDITGDRSTLDDDLAARNGVLS